MITVLEERPAGAPSNGHGLSSPGHQPQHGDRRPQRAPQHHAVPRITARAANEAWTWDISKFPTR